MNTKVALQSNRRIPVHFTVLVTLMLGLIGLYMYFLSMSVVHVVLRKEAAHKVTTLDSEIALLEATYIESQHLVSDHMARLAQFSATSEKIFVTQQSPTLVYIDMNQ